MGRRASDVGRQTSDYRLTPFDTNNKEPQQQAGALHFENSQLTPEVRRLASAYRPKYFALRSVNDAHFSGRSSSAKMADTGHTGTQAPQSMHSTGSMYSISSSACAGESFLGWMQSTGQ